MSDAQKPVAWVSQAELDELKHCNSMSIQAESPSIWEDSDPTNLVPVFAFPKLTPPEGFYPDGIAHLQRPFSMTIGQMRYALNHFDTQDEDSTETVILLRNLPAGHDTDGEPTPAGLYCWDDDLQDEGSLLLTDMSYVDANKNLHLCEIDRLKYLLGEVSSNFTRDDGLPDNLLSRIDKILGVEK